MGSPLAQYSPFFIGHWYRLIGEGLMVLNAPRFSKEQKVP
jgi:hypothetical protein